MAESSSFTPIVVYHSETADTLPAAVNLNVGELALNITDRKLYTKDSDDNIVLLSSMSFSDLEDIDISGLSDGDTIIWDSSTETWIVGSPDLGDLTDVDTSSAEDGDTLIFDSSTETWISGDVFPSSPTDGDTVVWDSSSEEWISTPLPGGSEGLGDAGLYRYWRVRWGSTKTSSATIRDGRLYTGGRGFARGQRWAKGTRLNLDSVSLSGGGISESVWKSFFGDGGTRNIALIFSGGAPDGSLREGVEIDFGVGNKGHISGVDFEDSDVPGANVPTIVEFSYSDDGVTWVVGSVIEELDERIGYDVDPTVDFPHFANISDTDPQTQFDRSKATIPFLDTSGGGGGGGDPYWDFDNTVKTGNFTAESGKYYFLETENFFGPSTYTITMPSSPSIGDRVGFACNLSPASYPTIDSTADYTDHKFDVQWDAGAGVATQVSLGYDGPSSGPGTYVMSVELYYLSADNWVIMNISRASIPGS